MIETKKMNLMAILINLALILIFILIEEALLSSSKAYIARIFERKEIETFCPKTEGSEILVKGEVYCSFDCDIICSKYDNCNGNSFNSEIKTCTIALNGKIIQMKESKSSTAKVRGNFQ